MWNKIRVLGLASLAAAAYAAGCSSDEGDDGSSDGGSGNQSSQSGGSEEGGSGGSVGGSQAGGGGPAGGSGGTESGGSGGSDGGTESGGTSGAAGIHDYPTGGGAGEAGAGATGGRIDVCSGFVGFEDCGSESWEAQQREVNVLLVMDKSGSMAQTPEGYDRDKWSAMRSALSTVLNRARSQLNLGLEFFPTSASSNPIPFDCGDSGRCCEMPASADMNVNIASGWDTVPEIIGQFQDAEPAGGTPTAVALLRAYEYFNEGPGASLTGDRIVLLATDGGPNCNPDNTCTVDQCTLNIDNAEGCPPDGVSCCVNTPTACLDHDGTMTQIDALASIGVPTIVVGIPGAEQYYSNLRQYAEAGGFINPDDTIGYYEVPASGGVQSLTETFETITVALVQDCDIEVGEEIQNPNQVNVAVNCEIVEQGEPEGEGSRWYFDDPEHPTRIIIDGPICDTIRDEGVERIDTIYGCPTQTLG